MLILDTTQVGCYFRALLVGLTYRKRCLPLIWSVHRGASGNVPLIAVIELLEQIAVWLPEAFK